MGITPSLQPKTSGKVKKILRNRIYSNAISTNKIGQENCRYHDNRCSEYSPSVVETAILFDKLQFLPLRDITMP